MSSHPLSIRYSTNKLIEDHRLRCRQAGRHVPTKAAMIHKAIEKYVTRDHAYADVRDRVEEFVFTLIMVDGMRIDDADRLVSGVAHMIVGSRNAARDLLAPLLEEKK